MIRKIREKTKQLTAGQVVPIIIGMIPTVVFLVFIYFMMIRTFTGTVKDTVKNTTLSFNSLETLSDSFEGVLEENFYDKDDYINLNGFTTKALGIHTLNERYLLDNGHLDYIGDLYYTEENAQNTIELNNFLNDRGIDFVYLLAPTKRSFYYSAYAPGYSSNDVRENYDTMIQVLDEAGVATVNMNTWFEENEWTMDDVFYRTDHHWTPQAGIAAARLMMESLSDRGLAEYNSALLDDDSWTITVYKDWYLGSHGRRTGIPYAGLDDIVLYQPNFATNYSYSYIRSDTTTWNYTDTILGLNYLEDIDYFNQESYWVYMGGLFPNSVAVNTEATNDQRVLIFGDSFRMPLEYFLTTEFKEIYTMDVRARYYTDGATLTEYIQEVNPDIVIMCTYSIDEKDQYVFGTSEYLTALEETDPSAETIELGDFIVEGDENDNNAFEVVCSNLKPGQTYTIAVDSVELSGGDGQHVQMTLQDISSNQAIINRYFDANCDDTQKWFFTVPENTDTYAVYLYAGTRDSTANISVEITDVELREGIFE